MKIITYDTVSNYYVDVWEDQTVVGEFIINVKSDDAIQKIRDFVSKYNYDELKDYLGVIK